MAALIRISVCALNQLLASCAAAAALLTLAPTASAQQGWAVCASEGQVCQVTGDAMVRYGVDGKYAFRNTQAPLVCGIESFGVDPVPGKRKVCEVSTSWRGESRYRGWRDSGQQPVGVGRNEATPGTWRLCAKEGELCEFPGTARVRYGANGRYATITGNTRVECSVQSFGTDPIVGVRKSCEVESAAPQWVLCASEGDVCVAPGTTTVRYGANGQYAERKVNGTIHCNSALFGDPVPGIAKQCEFKSTASSAIEPVVTALTWDRCAGEGKQCSFRGAAMVRYGVPGNYAYVEANNGLVCGVNAFGGDPAFGVVKHCDVLRLHRQ